MALVAGVFASLAGANLDDQALARSRPMVGAGWSSPVARQAHNLKVTGSNPVPATTNITPDRLDVCQGDFLCL